jgi:hypothetical protein
MNAIHRILTGGSVAHESRRRNAARAAQGWRRPYSLAAAEFGPSDEGPVEPENMSMSNLAMSPFHTSRSLLRIATSALGLSGTEMDFHVKTTRTRKTASSQTTLLLRMIATVSLGVANSRPVTRSRENCFLTTDPW